MKLSLKLMCQMKRKRSSMSDQPTNKENTMSNKSNNKPKYPHIKKGQVIPASGGIIDYRDGNGEKRFLLIRVFPKKS